MSSECPRAAQTARKELELEAQSMLTLPHDTAEKTSHQKQGWAPCQRIPPWAAEPAPDTHEDATNANAGGNNHKKKKKNPKTSNLSFSPTWEGSVSNSPAG